MKYKNYFYNVDANLKCKNKGLEHLPKIYILKKYRSILSSDPPSIESDQIPLSENLNTKF